MKKLILSFIFLICISCNERSLGKDYYFLSEIESKEYLTGSFVYKSFNENVFDSILVHPKVTNIKFDNKYIVAIQVPDEKLMLSQIKKDLVFWNQYYMDNSKDSLINLIHGEIALKNINNLFKKDGKINLTKVSDSIFKSSEYFKKIFKNKENYYIIQKSNDSIFGPLNLKEFEVLIKRKSIDLHFD